MDGVLRNGTFARTGRRTRRGGRVGIRSCGERQEFNLLLTLRLLPLKGGCGIVCLLGGL